MIQSQVLGQAIYGQAELKVTLSKLLMKPTALHFEGNGEVMPWNWNL